MTRAEVKQLAKEAKVHLWQVAEKLGVTDSTFSRKLRKPLNEADTAKVLEALDQLKSEQA